MKIIELTQGKHTMVDDEDYDFLMQWKWRAQKGMRTYYAIRTGRATECEDNNAVFCMHRVIMGITDHVVLIDHRDTNGLNNQRSNLRTCTYSENIRNMSGYKNDTTTSIYKGVYRKENGKWRSAVTLNRKKYNAGTHDSEIDAALAYNEIAKKMHGEFAYLNVIENETPRI